MALGVGSQADIDNRDVTSGEYAAVFIVPVVGVVVMAAFIIVCWRRGGRGVWKIPFVVVIGGLFRAALLVLISGSVRRGLLPTRPGHDGSCSACGVTLMPDAVFCQACGTPQPRRLGHRCAVCGYELPDGALWCPGCGAAVMNAPHGGQKRRRFTTAGVIVGFFAAFAGIGVFLTYLVKADRQQVPVSEGFSWACTWMVGSNHSAPANFEYGCNGGKYVLTFHNN